MKTPIPEMGVEKWRQRLLYFYFQLLGVRPELLH